MVTKGSFDYGPFTLAKLVEQIRTDQVVPGNLLIDNDTGERCLIEEHPYFGPMVEQSRQSRDDRRRANAEMAHAKSSKRRGLLLVGVFGGCATVLGLLVYVLLGRASDSTDAAPQGISAIGAGELQAKISFPKPDKQERKGSRGPRGGGGGAGSDTLALDMSEGGGSERLPNGVINAKIQDNGRRLGGCLASNGGGHAKIQFIIDGPTGRVNWVQVNGQQSGGLYKCLNRAVRSMKFPTVNGPRTRAEFEMSI